MMIQYNVMRKFLSEAVKVRLLSVIAFLDLLSMILLLQITPGKRSPTISSLDGDEDGDLYYLLFQYV